MWKLGHPTQGGASHPKPEQQSIVNANALIDIISRTELIYPVWIRHYMYEAGRALIKKRSGHFLCRFVMMYLHTANRHARKLTVYKITSAF